MAELQIYESVRRRVRQARGFTLIELLSCVALVGVLSAIAVPQYKDYRANGFDSAAYQSLRLTVTAEEAYFVENSGYRSCTQDDCAVVLPHLQPIPPGVLLRIEATETGFSGTASHRSGTGRIYTW